MNTVVLVIERFSGGLLDNGFEYSVFDQATAHRAFVFRLAI